MKTRPMAICLLLGTMLSGCAASSPGPESSGTATQTTAPAAADAPEQSAEPTESPSQARADNEPASLAEALAAAKEDHTDLITAIGAMEDLYRQAQVTLQPRMTNDEWNRLDLIRMRTSIGSLNGSMSDAQVFAGVQEYAAGMQSVALRLGAV